MATAYTVSDLGQVNDAGSRTALFLEVYSGMVLEAFNKKQTTMGRHIVRTISSGHQAQFPATGLATAGYHTAGDDLSVTPGFQQVNHNKRSIAIDGLLLSSIFVDILDEAMNHYEVRSIYSEQQGQALANQGDGRVLRAFAAASATATPTVTGLPGGTQLTNASMGTVASVLKGAIFDAAEQLDENNVPSEDRYVWLAPAQYYLLLEDGEFIDQDFNFGNGDKASGAQRSAVGFELVKTNNMPATDDSTPAATMPDEMELNYTTLTAIAGHKSAAGTVKLIDLQVESKYSLEKQGTILVAKYAQGHNYLRPEAAINLATAAVA